jgi:hypothetical protein
MRILRLSYFCLLLALIGCGSKASVGGVYKVEVPQSASKSVNVGKLTLKDDGSFTMTVGQMEMKGTWAQTGEEVAFTSADENAKMLSAQKFKVDGDKLMPVGELGVQNHWWLKKE